MDRLFLFIATGGLVENAPRLRTPEEMYGA